MAMFRWISVSNSRLLSTNRFIEQLEVSLPFDNSYHWRINKTASDSTLPHCTSFPKANSSVIPTYVQILKLNVLQTIVRALLETIEKWARQILNKWRFESGIADLPRSHLFFPELKYIGRNLGVSLRYRPLFLPLSLHLFFLSRMSSSLRI